MSRYNLKYKTLDSLLADVKTDLSSLSQNNMIDPQELIRVVRWVTKDLGLRIYKTKQVVLELNHGKVRLPEDFYIFNFGLLCASGSVSVPIPQGVRTEVVPYPSYADVPEGSSCSTTTCAETETPACGGCNSCDVCCPTGIQVMPGYNPLQLMGDPCVTPRVFLDCKGNAFELIQIIKTETRSWKELLPLRLVDETQDIACGCPNLYVNTADEIWIKDGFLYSNLKSGTVYVNYQGNLENENGELLILDHEKVTPFYEYAVKQRIFENLFLNGEAVEQKLAYVTRRYDAARADAWRVVKTPDFKEMETVWRMNRKAFNARYVDMFRSYNWLW